MELIESWRACLARNTDRVASRNQEARKAGLQEREDYERTREEARRAAAADRHAKLMKGRKS